MSFLINPFAFLAAGGDFESIATVTVGSGGASSIEFTSIPGTYQHLQVRALLKNSGGTTWYNADVNFNSDTGSNYSRHALYGSGSSAAALGQANQTKARVMDAVSGAKTYFGASVLDILDYADTTKYKTIRCLSGDDQNGSGYINLESSLWMSASAITSIKITSGFTSFVEHSTAALYGIKAP